MRAFLLCLALSLSFTIWGQKENNFNVGAYAGFSFAPEADIKHNSNLAFFGVTGGLKLHYIPTSGVLFDLDLSYNRFFLDEGRYGEVLQGTKINSLLSVQIALNRALRITHQDKFFPYFGAGTGVSFYEFSKLIRSSDLIQPEQNSVTLQSCFIVSAFIGCYYKVNNRVQIFVDLSWTSAFFHGAEDLWVDGTNVETMLAPNVSEPDANKRGADPGIGSCKIGVICSIGPYDVSTQHYLGPPRPRHLGRKKTKKKKKG